MSVIPFINNIGNKRVLEIFRSANNCIKQINMSMRTSHLVVINYRYKTADQLRKPYRISTVLSFYPFPLIKIFHS